MVTLNSTAIYSAGYTYQWQKNGVDIAGANFQNYNATEEGSYRVKFYDTSNNCNDVFSNTITVTSGFCNDACTYIQVLETVTDDYCEGSNGAIYLTLDQYEAPLNFQWSDGGTSQNRSNLQAGSYTVTITDANCTSLIKNYTINANQYNPVAGFTSSISNSSVTITDNSQYESSIEYNMGDGTIYNTSNPSHTYNGYGTFSICQTVINVCDSETYCENVTIGSPCPLVLDVVTTPATCGADNGTATISATSGTIASIQWDSNAGNQTSNPFTGLASGTYNVLITESTGCAIVQEVTIPQRNIYINNIIESGCDSPTSTYEVIISVSYENLSLGNQIRVEEINSGAAIIYTTGSNSGTTSFTFTGLTADEQPESFQVEDANDTNCNDLDNSFSAPPSGCTPQVILMGTTSLVNTCSAFFYDSGGANGQYTSNESSMITLCPSEPNMSTKVTFLSFDIESSFSSNAGYDGLMIYNGDNTNTPIINSGLGDPSSIACNDLVNGGFWGTNLPYTISSTHSSGCLTFQFCSDASITKNGWEAVVSCLPITCPGASNTTHFNDDTFGEIWRNNQYNSIDWGINSDTTLTENTGPNDDMTGGEEYIFVETTNSSITDVSILESDYMLLDGSFPAMLGFSYHMYGNHIGTLKIQYSNGNLWTDLWSKTASQGNVWINDYIDLSTMTGAFKLRFHYSNFGSQEGDTALDNLCISGIELVPSTSIGTSTSTVTTCLTHFYDSGGKDGKYVDNESATITFCPDQVGAVIQVNFSSFDIESNSLNAGYDGLMIYDGDNTSAQIINSGLGIPSSIACDHLVSGGFWGTDLPPIITSTHSSGCLTFQFCSDSSIPKEGWNALVACLPVYCPDDYNSLTGNVSTTIITDYETNGVISSSQTIDVNTDYDSGDCIELLPNFEVQLGVEFDAFIDGCNNGSGGNQ